MVYSSRLCSLLYLCFITDSSQRRAIRTAQRRTMRRNLGRESWDLGRSLSGTTSSGNDPSLSCWKSRPDAVQRLCAAVWSDLFSLRLFLFSSSPLFSTAGV